MFPDFFHFHEWVNQTRLGVHSIWVSNRVAFKTDSIYWLHKIKLIEPREIKRQGLIPFPRVGRNKDDNAGKKRDTMENGGAMWFGPRLGRLQKRNYFNDNENWALVKVAGKAFRIFFFFFEKPVSGYNFVENYFISLSQKDNLSTDKDISQLDFKKLKNFMSENGKKLKIFIFLLSNLFKIGFEIYYSEYR